MKKIVTLTALASMSAGERERALADLVNAAKAPPNGEVLEIDSKIAEYERRYELNSAQLEREIKVGRVRETAEIGDWLILIRLRERLAPGQA